MKCLHCVLPELHFSFFFIITRCMYGMHNSDYTQANPRFLFVRTNSEFKPVFESLLLHKKETKKGGKKKEKLFCIAPVCSPQPSVSSPAASIQPLSSPAVVGTLIALMDTLSVCVCVGGLSGSLRPHVLLSTAPLEAGPRELRASLLKIQLLSIIKCSLFEPEESAVIPNLMCFEW